MDATTCGPTVLLLLAAVGDPLLARWLADGTVPPQVAPHRLPPEIPPDLLAAARAAGGTTDDAAARIAAAQRWVAGRVRARALGLLRWPAALGTPPWTAAREARFPGVRYRSVPLDDATPAAERVLRAVHAATAAGTPVVLYTGGDLAGGLAAAVPRHLVLALPPGAAVGDPAVGGAADRQAGPRTGVDAAGRAVLDIFEPAAGRRHTVPVADLLARTGPHPALGGWSHVCWALLPVPAASLRLPGSRGRLAGATPDHEGGAMSTDPIAVEQDPTDLAEEHRPDPDPVTAEEEYAPDRELDVPTREADPADVSEQIAEVPVPDDEEGDETDEGGLEA
ncbi:hypothetical protein MF406_14840 [Georgenia sp. TF02-10]|uniref:hypothetical protein n=1 Tax=Georgenia sp. TF02-10 TaxID=2917725 RepID=UPI001FA7C18C|nr:hypothetical protein [Georgenia sp. TF02-10]UNX54193.1 hypothetical protein MF406_14840 [Georgenia sp. TF02-10]